MSSETINCQYCRTPNFASNIFCRNCKRILKGEPNVPSLSVEPIDVSQPVERIIHTRSTLSGGAKIIVVIVWGGVLLAALAAFSNYSMGMAKAETVFQQIASIADALLWIIIPYCIARAITEIAKIG